MKDFKFWPILGMRSHRAVRHIYCDMGHPFIMVIFKDSWIICCQAFGSGAVTTCFSDFGLSQPVMEHPHARLLHINKYYRKRANNNTGMFPFNLNRLKFSNETSCIMVFFPSKISCFIFSTCLQYVLRFYTFTHHLLTHY